MNAIAPRAVNAAWIRQQETLLACTAPSAARDAMEAELEEAKAARAAFDAIVSGMAKLGWRRNDYKTKCCKTGEHVEPLAGFTKKNTDGRWIGLSWAEALKKL